MQPFQLSHFAALHVHIKFQHTSADAFSLDTTPVFRCFAQLMVVLNTQTMKVAMQHETSVVIGHTYVQSAGNGV